VICTVVESGKHGIDAPSDHLYSVGNASVGSHWSSCVCVDHSKSPLHSSLFVSTFTRLGHAVILRGGSMVCCSGVLAVVLWLL
jgi:hypothetical protein